MADEKKDKPKDKTVTIIVNGTPHEVEDKKVSFEQLADLAFDGNPPTGENILITIKYSKGNSPQEGSLEAGGSVNVKDGMVFSVTATDKS